MGVRWEIYCAAHRERLNSGKIRVLEGTAALLRESPTKSIERIRQNLSKTYRNDPRAIPPPVGDRWFEIVRAFVQRHARCSLGLMSNSDPEYRQFSERVNTWISFDEWEDRILWDLESQLVFGQQGTKPKPPVGQIDLAEKIRNSPLPEA